MLSSSSRIFLSTRVPRPSLPRIIRLLPVSPTLVKPSSRAAKMSTRLSKRQKTSEDTPYELLYWPSLPGRGEHIRLAFEETGTKYVDVSNTTEAGRKAVLAHISGDNLGDEHNSPPLAPPVLKHGELLISQTSNILMYLGPRLGLVPDTASDPDGIYKVNALALTALDGLSNEAHDVHHPIASAKYYEDQKDEAKLKAEDYIKVRLPKFLGYFERVLKGQASKGGEFLYGGQLTYADLVLFQCIDGVSHALPNAMGRLRKEAKYEEVFGLYDRIKERENIKAYLASDRRQQYGLGIYRNYPELDEA
jgi:glutathione S-transferase